MLDFNYEKKLKMKMKYNTSLFRKILYLGVLLGITVPACTDLDETELLFDEVTTEEFYQSEEEILSAVGDAYTLLFDFYQNNNMMPLNEVTSDEIVVPTRGADWGDGGHWVRLHRHTWNTQDSRITQGWEYFFNGVNTCNRLLAILEPLGTEESEAFVSELKCLRAIYYYWLMDLYGNVPISTDFASTDPPPNDSRIDVYNFIETELTENAPMLAKTGPSEESTYGRVNYYTAQAALVKLYLNAEVYTGTEQWQKALDACDEIINSGLYSLTPTYRENFIRDNKGASEFIWAIPFDEVFAQGFHLPMITLHPESQKTYNMTSQPWNGFASIQEFYESYTDPAQNPGPQGEVVGSSPDGALTTGTLDDRLSNFIVGPQYDSDGEVLQDGGADQGDPNGPPITFTPYMNELEPAAWRQTGARIGKWEFYNGMGQFLSNDFAIFRYADILLSKAEALWRLNPADPEALLLVNQIRERANVTPFTSLDAEKLLAERGRELFAELHRRVDQIRFGTFNDAWRFKNADADDHVNIFPIPDSQLNANPNLDQNPGYPGRSGG